MNFTIMENTKTFYIAGKMRGLPDYGRQRFSDVQALLEASGYIVLNPASLPIGMPDEKYMPICLSMLEAADAVYMLNNWRDSVGARLEHDYAKCQGKEILYEHASVGKEQHGSTKNENSTSRAKA